MDEVAINNMLDQQRWLLDNGLFTDLAKDNLYLYGTLVHRDIFAVHVMIHVEDKKIIYQLYGPASLLKKVDDYHRWTKSTSLMDTWRLKRLVKKNGDLNFAVVLGRFIKTYCGSKWRVEVLLDDSKNYIDGVDEELIESRVAGDEATHRKPN